MASGSVILPFQFLSCLFPSVQHLFRAVKLDSDTGSQICIFRHILLHRNDAAGKTVSVIFGFFQRRQRLALQLHIMGGSLPPCHKLHFSSATDVGCSRCVFPQSDSDFCSAESDDFSHANHGGMRPAIIRYRLQNESLMLLLIQAIPVKQLKKAV